MPQAQLIFPCTCSSRSRLRSWRMCSHRRRVIAPFQYRLTPLRVRGIERVARIADLTLLGRLSVGLARARALPLAA